MRNISARQAVRNMRSIGEYAQWSVGRPEADAQGYDNVVGAMAGARVFREFTPVITPKFRLGENPALFTSGSCFAREIEYALHALGKTVLSWSPDSGLKGGSFNRYNIFSVINGFRLAQGGGYDEDLMWGNADRMDRLFRQRRGTHAGGAGRGPQRLDPDPQADRAGRCLHPDPRPGRDMV